MSKMPRDKEIEYLSQLHDTIYDIADDLLKKYNPCKIKNGDIVIL